MKLWQLKKLSTNEALNKPQPLPENWRNIFGLSASKDRLGDLSWAGHEDIGWFEVDAPEPEPKSALLPEPEPEKDAKTLADEHVQHLLDTTLPMVAFDNASMTKAKMQEWVEYRKKLQEIHLQVGYPSDIYWPTRPE